MESLRLAVRGLRWRRGSSWAVFAVAVVAMAGAALGPLYSLSAQDSLVRDGLARADASVTGVVTRGNVAGQTQFSPNDVADAVEKRSADPSLDPWYRTGTLAMTVESGSPSVDDRSLGQASVSWHRGQCEGISIVRGRCPDAAGQAMVSARFVDSSQAPIGTRMRLGISPDPVADTVVIVGVYDAATADPAVWGLDRPAQYQEARVEGQPDRLDQIVVDRATMAASTGDVAVTSLRTLDASLVHLSNLDALRSAVETATTFDTSTIGQGLTEPRTVSTSGLPEFLDTLAPALASVQASAFAVTAQLVLLAWFVLFLIVASTSDERSGEIALAKLRGMSSRATVAFGLAEPLLLLALAAPVGVLLAWLADVVLTARTLVPGTAVSFSASVLLAVVVCFLGGAVAAALAARGILTAPVLEQLRRTSGSRARLLRSSAVDAAAVALAAAGIYELTRGGNDALALVTPGLIALAAGLLAVRLVPWVARVEVRRTTGSPKIAAFLSSRNIARRPSGLRIVVLLSLAVALAVFAVDGWVVAAANRANVARAQVGASEVLHVHAPSAGELMSAVDAADPSGTQALAAVSVDNGAGGLLAVDARRLVAVSAWDPAWAGLGDDVGALLHPPAQAQPVPISGRLRLTADYERKAGDAALNLGVDVRAASGVPLEVSLGPLHVGSATYDVPLPGCIDLPCTLTAFVITEPITLPATNTSGTVTLSDVNDASGVVDLAAPGPTGWRSGVPNRAVPILGGAEVTSLSASQMVLEFVATSRADAGVEVADHPAQLPVVQGDQMPQQEVDAVNQAVVAGLDGRFTAVTVVSRGLLPRLGRQGTLADLRYAVAATGLPPDPMDMQVWLSPTATDSVRASLVAAGIDVLSVETIAEQQAVLDRSGSAIALRLFLFAALLALVLGAGTLLAQAYVVIRRRAYELAALRAIGAPHSTLVSAARREQVALALTGVALGAVAGLVAAAVALPPLLSADAADGPPPWYGPALGPVAVLVLAIVVLLVVVADVGARRTVRRALPDLLRQVQE